MEEVWSTIIMIQSNIVIRGEPTNAAAKKGTKPGPPKTVFKRTFGQHIGVLNNDPKGANFGIVNAEMDGCAVMFLPGLKSFSTNIKTLAVVPALSCRAVCTMTWKLNEITVGNILL